MPQFIHPDFSVGSVEFRCSDGEVALYGTKEGLEKLAVLLQKLLAMGVPDHIHLEDYGLLTDKSLIATIALLEKKHRDSASG